MLFLDRREAGQRLAVVVKERGLASPVVLGIPGGGVPVAIEVARAIGGEAGVVVARKLGAPANPELAIGATTSTGVTYMNTAVAAAAGADERYIATERERQVREARRREKLFDSHRRPRVEGRAVVVVDDGLATGATAIAAVRAMKAARAARVVLAVPVGPPQIVDLLRLEADEVICLYEDPGLWAVGQFYVDFDPLSDAEVREMLDAYAATLAAADPGGRVEFERSEVPLAGTARRHRARRRSTVRLAPHSAGQAPKREERSR